MSLATRAHEEAMQLAADLPASEGCIAWFELGFIRGHDAAMKEAAYNEVARSQSEAAIGLLLGIKLDDKP